MTGDMPGEAREVFVVLVHRRLRTGCLVGPDVVYVGDDDLAALLRVQEVTVGPDVTCVAVHTWRGGRQSRDPVLVLP